MEITETLEKYKAAGNYFAPDYDQENEVLTEFKKSHPILSQLQVTELIDLLENSSKITDKYFVADLLYLYDDFDKRLLEPLIKTAINHKDPSFNRIFLQPCINRLGVKVVADILADKFNKAGIIERIGISNLAYWLRPQQRIDVDKLRQAILERANNTSNLIELYHYKLRYQDEIKNKNIPNNAADLISAVIGHKEYEEILFDKLGWAKR